jgi:hypothetical protein
MFEDKKAARLLKFFGFIASHPHRLRFPLNDGDDSGLVPVTGRRLG